MASFIAWLTGPAAPAIGVGLSVLGILGAVYQKRWADMTYWLGSTGIFISLLMR